jgi:hypothetical protein
LRGSSQSSRLTSNCGLMRFDAGTALSCHKPTLTAHLKASTVLYRSVQSKSLELEPERRPCRSCSEAPRKLTRSMSRRCWLNSATRQKRRMSAIGCVALCIAKVAAFSLHSSRARLSDWLVPNSSPIFQPARPFVGSPLLSSRRIIVDGVSAKSLLPARSTSLASITAQALRSPVRSIVLTRTGFTSG